ncbi:MAG: hypothetical protein JXR78_10875 [Victivallales bacterium]|nr:hypothetical protein [Victivallales bacterium]
MSSSESMLENKETWTLDPEKYEHMRVARKNVNMQVVEKYLGKPELTKVGRTFGLVRQGAIEFEEDEEVNSLVDFSMRRQKKGDKTPIEQAIADKLFSDEYEQEYLRGMIPSHASLFEIIGVATADGYVLLKDCLFPDRLSLRLYDVGFSITAIPGTLIFIVAVPVFDIHISSGISYIFTRNIGELIKRECFMRHKNKEIFSNEAKRCKLFFHLNRKYGNMIHFIDNAEEY